MPAFSALRWFVLPCVAWCDPAPAEVVAKSAAAAEAPSPRGHVRSLPGTLVTTVKHVFGARVIVHEVRGQGAEGPGIRPISGLPRWGVTFKHGCTSEDLKGLRHSLPNGSRPIFEGRPSQGGLCFFELEGTEHHVRELLRRRRHRWPSRPTVESVFEWSTLPVLALPDDATRATQLGAKPSASNQSDPPSWGLDRIDARGGLDQVYAPANGLGGSGVHVYMLDSGIRTTHTDFGGRAIPTLEVIGDGVVPCLPSDTACASDQNGHGTHTAGTVGGTMYGVAKDTALHAVQVLRASGGGAWSWFVAAIDWIVANGQRPAVISASLGGPGNIHSVEVAIDAAVSAGVTVVVAAGNSGLSPQPDACAYTPAGVRSAITVGSTNESDHRSVWSNIGSCLDLFAPGSNIVSAWVSSDTAQLVLSGTSMACPHVAGAAALLLQEDSSRTPAQVREALAELATSGALTGVGQGSPNRLVYVGAADATAASRP